MTTDDGRRTTDERRGAGLVSALSFPLSLLLPLTLSLLLAGCGLGGINFGGEAANTGAHTVFLVRDGCATFVARTLGRDFVLAEAAESAYVPAPGDVLEGPAREGRSVFALYPPAGTDAGSPTASPTAAVPLDVRAVGLLLADARAGLDAACGPPAR